MLGLRNIGKRNNAADLTVLNLTSYSLTVSNFCRAKLSQRRKEGHACETFSNFSLVLRVSKPL